jgi:hypothetical protein
MNTGEMSKAITFQFSLHSTFVILSVVKDLRLFFLASAVKAGEAKRSILPEIGRKATADPSSLRSSG